MENLGFGLWITLVGMALVFALLAVLWGLLALLLRLDRADDPAPQPAAVPAATVEVAGAQLDADTLAAIMIAVLTHATVRRKQAAPTMRSYLPGSLLYASRWVAAGRASQSARWARRR